MKKNENTAAAQAKENTAAQPFPMKVDVKIGSIRPTGNIRATASVNLNDCFAIRNVRIIDSSKGLFVSMPSYKAGNGEYKDICFPVTAAFRQQLNDAVINAYHQALSMNQSQAPTHDDLPFASSEQASGMQMG